MSRKKSKKPVKNKVINKDKDSHKLVRRDLLLLQNDLCIMTGILLSSSSGSFHHMVKDCDGGPYTFNNGVMLFMKAHRCLHEVLERFHKDDYIQLHRRFLLYKQLLLELCSYDEEYIPRDLEEEQEEYIEDIQIPMRKLILSNNWYDSYERGVL